MISFVWYSRFPFLAGAGGTEAFTAGVLRELLRRGKKAQLVTVGFGEQDGREGFPDIPFKAVDTPDDVAELGGTIIFALDAPPSKIQYPAYFMLHCPVWLNAVQAEEYRQALEDPLRKPIANSMFAAREWEKFLGEPADSIPVVYPFAHEAFSAQQRIPRRTKKVRILYANRLHPNKGIYTFMAALHHPGIHNNPHLEFSVTSAAAHTPEGKVIKKLIDAHPRLTVIPPRKTPMDMAALMAEYDVVVVPSSAQGWRETFGMTSVEAQKVGCRVVASNDGGLPETDCGGLILVKPDDSEALATGIMQAASQSALTPQARLATAPLFTVAQTVDSLLQIID